MQPGDKEIERLITLHEAAAARAELAQIEIARLRVEIERLTDEVALWKDRWESERRDHEATIRNTEYLLRGEP